MKQTILTVFVILAATAALASGYGGYDYEEYPTGYVEVMTTTCTLTVVSPEGAIVSAETKMDADSVSGFDFTFGNRDYEVGVDTSDRQTAAVSIKVTQHQEGGAGSFSTSSVAMEACASTNGYSCITVNAALPEEENFKTYMSCTSLYAELESEY